MLYSSVPLAECPTWVLSLMEKEENHFHGLLLPLPFHQTWFYSFETYLGQQELQRGRETGKLVFLLPVGVSYDQVLLWQSA